MRTGSATMTDAESVVASFASSSRAGRRNALPDIRSPAAPGEASERAAPPQTGAEKEDVQQKSEETIQDQLENPKEEEK